MSKLRIESFSISVDGFGAGPNQDLAHPLGVGGTDLHKWALSTRTFQKNVFGNDGGGATGVDDDYAARGFRNVGAWILGRNMFGPLRGPWPDDARKGWWGDKPPYQVPVFVLTHYARPSITMQGGTVFHFVTDGIHEARRLAIAAAGSQDVRIGGGAATIRQYLKEGLIDEMHVAIAPVLLGSGAPLFAGLDLRALGYQCVEHTATRLTTHLVIAKA